MSLPPSSILTDVQRAVREGRPQDVGALLAGHKHWPIPTLSWAIEQGDAALFGALWEAAGGANNNINVFIYSMQDACRLGATEILKFLLPKNSSMRNEMALGYAAKEGQLEVVKTILQHGHFEGHSSSHLMAMAAAVSNQHWPILDVLLNFGDAPIDLLRHVIHHTMCDHDILHELIQYYHDGDVALVMDQEIREAGNAPLPYGAQILQDVIAVRDHKRALEDALWDQEHAAPKARKM